MSLATVALLTTMATAQDASIWSHQLGKNQFGENAIDSGWVVTIPTQASDWASAAYNVTAGVGDNDDRQFINGNMNVNSLGISVADFGTTQTYTNVGVFRPNRPLDPSGLTPDLSLPIATSTKTVTGTPLFTFQYFPTTTEGDIPAGDTTAVAAVQFPVGDPGLLMVGGDSTVPRDRSYSSQDAYATPGVFYGNVVNWGMRIY